jgi:3-deoxy-D-manno-octulosonic-acid transferase
VFNFQEIYGELTAAGGAVVVADRDGLVRAVGAWLRDPAAAATAGERGCAVVESNRGATSRTVDALLNMAGGPSA